MTRNRKGGNGTEPEKARKARVVRGIARAYPDAECALRFVDPFECLVATVLSAQCTDARVNMVTKVLFGKYRSAADFVKIPRERLEAEIRSTGFFRSKAKAIQALSAAILERHGGKVPDNMEDLVALPGVGRKTANVVLGEAFGTGAGIVVDTHVHRLSRRLGLTREEDPVKIERDLMQIVPRREWIHFGMRMITHGRAICTARKPACERCTLLSECPFGSRQDLSTGAKAISRKRSPARIGKAR
jgi:endonuclease-3